MGSGRTTGPDEIPVEFWKSAATAGKEWLTELYYAGVGMVQN